MYGNRNSAQAAGQAAAMRQTGTATALEAALAERDALAREIQVTYLEYKQQYRWTDDFAYVETTRCRRRPWCKGLPLTRSCPDATYTQ